MMHARTPQSPAIVPSALIGVILLVAGGVGGWVAWGQHLHRLRQDGIVGAFMGGQLDPVAQETQAWAIVGLVAGCVGVALLIVAGVLRALAVAAGTATVGAGPTVAPDAATTFVDAGQVPAEPRSHL